MRKPLGIIMPLGIPLGEGGRALVNGSFLPDVSYDAPQDGRQRGWGCCQHIFCCLNESTPVYVRLQCYQGTYIRMCTSFQGGGYTMREGVPPFSCS